MKNDVAISQDLKSKQDLLLNYTGKYLIRDTQSCAIPIIQEAILLSMSSVRGTFSNIF